MSEDWCPNFNIQDITVQYYWRPTGNTFLVNSTKSYTLLGRNDRCMINAPTVGCCQQLWQECPRGSSFVVASHCFIFSWQHQGQKRVTPMSSRQKHAFIEAPVQCVVVFEGNRSLCDEKIYQSISKHSQWSNKRKRKQQMMQGRHCDY